jgi:mycothiol synthase
METTWSERYTSRPATVADAEAVTELMNLCSVEILGHPTTDVSEALTDWSSPYCNPATNTRLVFDGDRLVGYAGLWSEPPYVVLHAWARVHPEYKRQGIGTYLASWLETTAREQALPVVQDGIRVILHQGRPEADVDSRALLEAQGYRAARYFLRMLIELDAHPPAPQFPAHLIVRTFDRSMNLPGLVRAEQEAFRDHWGYVTRDFDQELEAWEHWIDNDPHHDPSLWFLVMDGEEIAGVCLCTGVRPGEPEMGYVNSLGVRRAWRKMGIGLAMLHHAFGEFYRRGKTQVSLDVDAESLTGATRLYEKAGMHVQRQSIEFELVLQEGKDLSTQTLEG